MKNIFSQSTGSKLYHYILSFAIIGGVAIICTPLANTQNYHLVSYILLFIVSIQSAFLGVGPVLLAAALSALIWNFFFIPPHYTFHIDKTEDILIFGLFFIIAIVNGVLITRIRRQEKLAREREGRTNALFQLTRELSRAGGIENVLKVAVEEIIKNFTVHPVFLLQDGNNKLLAPRDTKQGENKLSPIEYSAAEWAFKHSQKAGAFTENVFQVEYTIFPLIGTRLNPGVVAIKNNKPFEIEQRSFWNTFLVQISNALEREFLGEMAQKVRFLDESDRLYKTLFNSISHELRIPVSTIMGASDSILNADNSMDVQRILCHEIFSASLRLNRVIENLLNISRLESGHISVRLDWYDINDLVNKVTADLKDELKPFSFHVTIPEEMPLVKIDFGLMEQVLYNLLFNATQFAPGHQTFTFL
jgi:K+-sensing histidine kinase KdpD